MDNLLPPLSQSAHPHFDEPSTASPLPQAVTDFRATSAPVDPPDAGMRHDALPATKSGTPVLDVIAAHQQTAEYFRHVTGSETLLAATHLASAQSPTSDHPVMSSLANAGRGASELLVNSALTANFAASLMKPASTALTFLTGDTASMQPVTKPVTAPDHAPAADHASLITLNDASDLQSQPLKLSSYSMDLGPIWEVAPGGGWTTGGGDGGWNISIGPINPVMPGFYPPPVRLPSPAEMRWNDAHSPDAMATYGNIFRDVFGRNASDVDLNWAAQQVGNGWTIEQYRWDQSHTVTAFDIYRGVFRDVHGHDAAQVDVDFAAQKIGHGASLQQYRWDEAHNDEALGREYKAVFKSVHGREAQQVDLDFAAQKIGYGASLQQYRWDEAHNDEALGREYKAVFRTVHGHDAHQVDIDFAAQKIGNGASLEQYRWDEAHNDEALGREYKAVFRSVHGRDPAQSDLDFAAKRIGTDTSVDQYRWDEAHGDYARENYAKLFKEIHGRDPAQSDLDFAAKRMGTDTSMQQYRWDEAHGDYARGNYAELFKDIHGRDATAADIDDAAKRIGTDTSWRQYRLEETRSADVVARIQRSYQQIYTSSASSADIDAIAQKIADGASWQQYWKDEANSPAARAGYANAYKNIHAHDPSQADIDWAAEQISNGYSLKDYRTIEAQNAESTRAITTISEEVNGTAPTEAQLKQARYYLGGGWGLDYVRIKLAYSPETANRLYKLYDDAVAGLGDTYRETIEVGREVFAKTLQYAVANKEIIFENIVAASLARWIPGTLAKYLAASIMREGMELISDTISSNTSHQPKITLKEPTQDGATDYYPSPSVVTLRKYLDAYFQTDDDDLVAHISSLPISERLPYLKELTGATEEELQTLLIMANALPDDPVAAPPGGNGGSDSSDNGGGPPDDDDKNLDKFPKLGQSDGGPGTYVKANESFGEEAAAYQERVTGTPQGMAYRVPKGNNEFVKFDGYDAERDVLQDAKYYRNWPLPDKEFSRDSVMTQIRSQVDAAKGRAIEWIVPSQDAADRILEILDGARFDLDKNNFSVRVVP
ncbi:restriction endonuclease fold toxin 5 domain-containing protein [Candidatus Kirkpatrickella diaphorinae]|uniref:Restriction endonuclease fold toxin 5 domain-containing protein n=1 Tax=Candidatus Kirkpatrickella diaphorinae TaxID=2984322 RepID=A0ABY6GHQ0_9PROT|nr:Tox-REase-5 domain-containing protein [Candidatus Kirkpatrickella diaphorinae]UYH50774.1 restriction endonuclease fold toxin 5 domain-containing protein [Candidatus Kirkpatrickella diaphorinae]